jgi:hypothetical protein
LSRLHFLSSIGKYFVGWMPYSTGIDLKWAFVTVATLLRSPGEQSARLRESVSVDSECLWTLDVTYLALFIFGASERVVAVRTMVTRLIRVMAAAPRQMATPSPRAVATAPSTRASAAIERYPTR